MSTKPKLHEASQEGPSAPDDTWLLEPLYDASKVLAPPNWVIRDFIEVSTTGSLYGPSGSLKSFIALAMAASIITGSPFCGRKVKRGAVVYIANEGKRGLDRRLRAWEKQHGPFAADESARLVRPRPPNGEELESVDLLNGYVKKLGAAIKAYNVAHPTDPVRLVVFDTLAKSLGGEEETNEAFSAAISNLEKHISPLGPAVVLVHHTGKNVDSGPRGGSSLPGGIDFLLETAAIAPNGHPRKGDAGVVDFQWRTDSVRLRSKKQKDEEKAADLWFRAERLVLGVAYDDDGDAIEITSLVLKESEPVKEQPKESRPKSKGSQWDGAEEAEMIRRLAAGGLSKTAITKKMTGRRDTRFARVDAALDRSRENARGAIPGSDPGDFCGERLSA